MISDYVKYADCISVEGQDTGYDTKPSDGEAPVLELWAM